MVHLAAQQQNANSHTQSRAKKEEGLLISTMARVCVCIWEGGGLQITGTKFDAGGEEGRVRRKNNLLSRVRLCCAAAGQNVSTMMIGFDVYQEKKVFEHPQNIGTTLKDFF